MRSFKSAFDAKFLQQYQQGTLRYSYRGIRCIKSPIDMAIYMSAIWDLQPKTIIEIGSQRGGGALLLADIATNCGTGAHIISIDLEPPTEVIDERIMFLEGDVCKLEEVFEKHDLYNLPRPWLISEDSAHSYEGCKAALYFFAKHLRPGDILAMEDGILDELGLTERYNGGPNRAIEEFFEEQPETFEVMTDLCDMFGPNMTYNLNGYLKKI